MKLKHIIIKLAIDKNICKLLSTNTPITAKIIDIKSNTNQINRTKYKVIFIIVLTLRDL